MPKERSHQFFFHLRRRRRNFSLGACYLLKFTCCSLHVVKSLVTRCNICSLLVAEVARCKKSLLTRWRRCSLQKITHYLSKNSLVTRCRNCSMQKLTLYSLQNFLVTRGISCSLQEITCQSLWKKSLRTSVLFKANKDRWILFIYSLFSVD